jgi:hypothetical protein
MQIQRQWSNEQDIFGLVSSQLEGMDDADVIARDEQDSYGDEGYIMILRNGRVFKLLLAELV